MHEDILDEFLPMMASAAKRRKEGISQPTSRIDGRLMWLDGCKRTRRSTCVCDAKQKKRRGRWDMSEVQPH